MQPVYMAEVDSSVMQAVAPCPMLEMRNATTCTIMTLNMEGLVEVLLRLVVMSSILEGCSMKSSDPSGSVV